MVSQTNEKHKEQSPVNVECSVITLSDSIKELDDDLSGNYIAEKIKEKYTLNSRSLIHDEADSLLEEIEKAIGNETEVIITTGGTGLNKRDITVETVEPLFEKKLDGFGEIFRLKSYEEIGASAILSRATGGVYKKTLIFALPGSPNAVKTGLDIIINELGHFVHHARK